MGEQNARGPRRSHPWWRRAGVALVAVAVLGTTLVTGGSVQPDVAEATPVAPPFPDCVLSADGLFWLVPPGFPPGTQCVPSDQNGATLTPDRSVISWGDEVTFTYAADNVGDPDNPRWGVSWGATSSTGTDCGSRDLTCTVRFTPSETIDGLAGRSWSAMSAGSGGRRNAYAGVWVTPIMYSVDVRARTDAGTQAYGGSTKGGVAVRVGTDPNLSECLNGGGAFMGGFQVWNFTELRQWVPDDGIPDCAQARYINADIPPEIWPAWTFPLPAGEWDLYMWDDIGPDLGGKARQPTPYDVKRVTVTDVDQELGTVLRPRPRPTVQVQVEGSSPVAIGQHRTVKVTVNAGAGPSGHADVRFDPAEVGLTSSDPAAVEITSGPDPAPVTGGFRMFDGQQRVFTYDVVAKAEGDITLTAKIESTDDLGVVTRSSATAGVDARVVRELQLRNLRSDPVEPGQDGPFTVRGEVVNIGNVDVDGIAVSGAVDTSLPGAADIGTGSTIATLAPGASAPITLSGTLRQSGATVRVLVDGTARDDGSPVHTSERLRVGKAPSLLSVSVDGPRTVILDQGDEGPEPTAVAYTFTLTNDGNGPLSDVQLGTPRLTPQDGATEAPMTLAEPIPNALLGDLAPGQQVQITYHYSATTGGRVELAGTAFAQFDGEWVSSDFSTRVTVADDSDLQIDTSGVPSSVEPATTFDANVKITNTTDHDVDDITFEPPKFSTSYSIKKDLEGDDVAFFLAPGESRTVRYQFELGEEGTTTITFNAAGVSNADGTTTTHAGTRTTDVSVGPGSPLSWKMEPRYTGQGTEAHTYEDAHPDSWSVDLAYTLEGGCDGADLELTRVQDGEQTTIDALQTDAAECVWTVNLEELGEFELQSKITEEGETLLEHTDTLEPKDLVVVSVGDSMSSGEGARDPELGWESLQCDRSGRAGPALAAKTLEDDGDPDTKDDDHSTVTFVHLACSGGTTNAGLLAPYVGQNPWADLMNVFGGQNPFTGSALPPQIMSIPTIVGDREVSALLMTAGINDITFSEFLQHCIINTDCPTVPLGDGTMPQAAMDFRIGQLDDMYERLNHWINKVGIASDDVYLLEYPDPSKDDAGEYCTSPFDIGQLTDYEYSFLDQHMQTPLNAAGAAGAAANGWHRVNGVAAAFRTHGICSSQPWSNTIPNSFASQGTPWGGFHPNLTGHQVFGQLIHDTMKDGGVGVDLGTGGPAATTTDGDTPAGSTEMELRNSTFAVNDVVTVNPGGANQETRRIDGLGSIIFDVPLAFDHFDGELIVLTSELPAETGADRPPTANADTATIAPTGRTVVDVLGNDTDPDAGDALRIAGWGGSEHWAADESGTAMVWDSPTPSCEPVTVSYRAVDSHGATSEEAAVTLTPDCPTLGLTVAPVSTPEGTPATVTAAVDGAVGSVLVDWDLDGDGAYDDATGTSVSLPAPDGPAAITVAARVADQAGRVATGAGEMTVVNVAPTGTLTAPGSVVSGTSFTLAVTNPADVAADLPVAVTWSCGGGPFVTSPSCEPAAAGPYAVAARLDDGDGGVTTLTGSVTVTPPPTTTTTSTTSTSTTSTTAPSSSTTTTRPTTDRRAPTLSLVRPRPGEVWSGETRLLALKANVPPIVHGSTRVVVTATDDVGVTRVVFKVDGRVVATSSVSRSSDTYSFTYRPVDRFGVDTISVEAHDASGKVTRAAIPILGIR